MAGVGAKSSKAPQVIVVLTTQWRASALGCAGDPNARTPALDGLAREGLWLTQATTPHPFGVFARAAFLTATRSPDNGVADYYDPLPADARTLAHAFSGCGYATAFFGKWQLFERDPSAPVVGEAHARVVVPVDRRGGFEHWEGFESGFLLNDPLLHGSGIGDPIRFAGYQSDVVLERAMEFLRSRVGSDRPVFAVVSLDAPHPPYLAPAAGVEPRPASEIRLLEGTGPDEATRAEARRELAGYYAHIEATDRAIGRFVEALKAEGSWADTLFAFASVHGDMHGVEGMFRKGWPQEESVRVPLILVGKGRVPAGERSEALLGLEDLGPSLLGLAVGSSAAEAAVAGCHGRDWSDALQGRSDGPVRQEISMPSCPPFSKQCPYRWRARRERSRTEVFPEFGSPFTLWHEGERGFEAG